MILPDNTPESPTKSRPGPLSDVAEEDIAPPPAYPGHNSSSYHQPYVDIEAQASSSRTPLVPPTPTSYIEEVEHAPRRFLKAFALAVLIYLSVGALTGRIISVASWSGGSSHLPMPKPSDGKVERCISVSDYDVLAAEAKTSLNLPLSAPTLYILGRGSLTHGSITFSRTNDPSIPAGFIRVDIVAHPKHSGNAALNWYNICLLERTKGEKGIAILTPSNWHSTDDLSFTIDVRLPDHADAPLHINAFETNLPLFKHTLSGLEGLVSFGSLQLSSTNKLIDSSYLQADKAIIHTTNAHITGIYHVSQSLQLVTSNGLIDADITLHNDPQQRYPTNLTMHTSNALIDSRLSLNATPSLTGGAFSISSYTENGVIDLKVPTLPVDSTLWLDARSSNKPITVHLPVTYEGAFALGSSNGNQAFNINTDVADPAGRGRRRRAELLEKTAAGLKGRTWWGYTKEVGEGASRGRVTIRSENAPVGLVV